MTAMGQPARNRAILDIEVRVRHPSSGFYCANLCVSVPAKLCRNFPLGTCRYGHNCSYLHTAPSTRPPPLLSPVPTAACSFFYPTTLSIPNAPAPAVPPALAASQQSTAPDAPTKDTRPLPGPGTGSDPGPLPQTHDGRTRASRRDQPHTSRRGLLPRAHTPAGEYTASECPDSQTSNSNNFNIGRNQDRTSASVARIQRWRRGESASPATNPEARCAPTAEAEARQFPPAPPATPVSVASPEARWTDLGGGIGPGAGERYRWTGNGVLRWANATSGRGSVSPPPQQQQQQMSSTMARDPQAPKLFKHRNQFFKSRSLVQSR